MLQILKNSHFKLCFELYWEQCLRLSFCFIRTEEIQSRRNSLWGFGVGECHKPSAFLSLPCQSGSLLGCAMRSRQHIWGAKVASDEIISCRIHLGWQQCARKGARQWRGARSQQGRWRLGGRQHLPVTVWVKQSSLPHWLSFYSGPIFGKLNLIEALSPADYLQCSLTAGPDS